MVVLEVLPHFTHIRLIVLPVPLVATNQASLVEGLTNISLVMTFAPSHINDSAGLAGIISPDYVVSVSYRVYKLVHFDNSFTGYTVFLVENCAAS